MALWICDVNGVLIDSCALSREAFVAAAARDGLEFGDEHWRRVNGLPLRDAYGLLLGAAAADAACAAHLTYLRRRLERIRPCDGVAEVLSVARATGVRIGATTSYGAIAEACLVHTGLYPLIDWLVTQEEVRRAKPDPESILRIMALSGVPRDAAARRQVLYVGDTAADIVAGKAAGVRTIGVTYGVSTVEDIRAAAPDQIVGSFRQLMRLIEWPRLARQAASALTAPYAESRRGRSW